MRKIAVLSVLTLLVAAIAGAQALTTPPSGDNQHAIVTQFIGPVKITVDYNSPKVHSPATRMKTGAARSGAPSSPTA